MGHQLRLAPPRFATPPVVAPIRRLPMAARWVAVVVLTVALAGCGRGSSQPTSPGSSASFLGNSFSSGVADSVPHSVMELAVSKDGVAVSGSSWEEYNHDARLFAPESGQVLGPFTPTRNTGGIYGVAIDAHYVYAISGLSVYRFSRARWMNPGNRGWFDDGSNTGVRPLAVDSSGTGRLMGLAECDGELFVSDPGDGRSLGDNGQVSPDSAQIKVIGPNLTRVIRVWNVPRARSVACDRQGDIWVLQQGVAGGPRPQVERFTPSGRLLASFVLPGYPTGLAADPTSNSIVVPDNGPDQDFKRFDYGGRLIGTIGVKHGYLAGPDPGVVGPDRFVGPRAVAIDGAGNIYTAESGLPGVGQKAWSDMGPMAIITKFRPDGHTVVWRDYGLEFADVGEPSSNGSRFYDRHWEYKLDSRGRYEPYAYTVDPFRYPSDDRVGHAGDDYGASTRVIDLHGHRYLTMTNTPAHQFEIYIMRGDIAQPVVWFDSDARINTNGHTVDVSSNPRLPTNNGSEDWWMDSSGDIWSVGGLHGIWRYKLQGFAANGAPRYNFRHVARYPFPPELSQPRRIEVFGKIIYVSGFASSDPDPQKDWDGWKSIGRHLLKFDSLPTASGWPVPVWEDNFSYGTGSGSGETPEATGYPTSFAAADGAVAVAWLFSPRTDQGRIDVLAASDGATEKSLSPPVPSLGKVGWLDMEQSIEAQSGLVWAEDDWQSKIYRVCLTRCSNS